MGASLGYSYPGTSVVDHDDAGCNSDGTCYAISAGTVSYDALGRNTNSTACTVLIDSPSVGALPGCGNAYSGNSTVRQYDVENHVVSASGGSIGNNATANSLTNTYTWGVNGHPLTVAGSSQNSALGGQSGQDLLFWDGGILLFTMEQPSAGGESLNDVKMESLAEYTPLDDASTGYRGVTFYDRRPDGSVAFCHNNSGAGGSGTGDAYVTLGKWGGGVSKPCFAVTNPTSVNMPANVVWNGSWNGQLSAASPPVIGAGWTIGEIRDDGFEDGVDTVQGVRAYDPTPGQWTTPDAYAGSVHDPMSQRSYIWNGNNPVSYDDPTGFDIQMAGSSSQEIQKRQDDFLNFLVQLTNEGDSEALNQVKYLAQSDKMTTIIEDNDFSQNGDDFNYSTLNIKWNPNLAIKGYDGNNAHVISPTVNLVHELGHDYDFQTDPVRYFNDMSKQVPGYGGPSDQRVMQGVEADTLRHEGLPPRTDHQAGTICQASNLSACYPQPPY